MGWPYKIELAKRKPHTARKIHTCIYFCVKTRMTQNHFQKHINFIGMKNSGITLGSILWINSQKDKKLRGVYLQICTAHQCLSTVCTYKISDHEADRHFMFFLKTHWPCPTKVRWSKKGNTVTIIHSIALARSVQAACYWKYFDCLAYCECY